LDLLSAFDQDIQQKRYHDYAALLDYCSRSADPIGTLMLHLYQTTDVISLTQSKAICSALQLINFLQDVAIDWKKERIYLPQEDLVRFGVTEEHMALAQAADAVLFGAVGGPKWDAVPYDVRPEAGLLRLRKDLALFANLRPAICYPALADASSLKREIVEDLDIMIVRELTGGVYFGEPKQIIDLGNGQKRGIDTQIYDTYEIERIGRVAFELARKRNNKVTSSEKRNVMKSGVLWNEVMTALHKREFPDVQLEHQLADSLGMQLVRWPKQFDVIVTDNLFGDMLSDVAAMLTGSLGMLPSASLGETNPKTGQRKALYEPVHGSAPDIAGKGLANPIAMIGSFGMALRYSFGLGEAADMIEKAISNVLASGLRTADIKGDATSYVSTTQMGEAIVAELKALAG
jgi:3-isopropylmalate dehydrogenase